VLCGQIICDKKKAGRNTLHYIFSLQVLHVTTNSMVAERGGSTLLTPMPTTGNNPEVILTTFHGNAITQAVSHQPLTAETWVHAWLTAWGFVVDKVVMRQVFL
jgi:hypothetical protein